jgi:hypothetical protein
MQSGNLPQSLLDNFQKGDLVFGLAQPRMLAVKQLKELGHRFVFANELNDKVVSIVMMDGSPDSLSERKKLQYGFLFPHKDYLLKSNGKPIPAMRKSDIMSAGYRRACKLLVRNRHENYRVHFLLAEINWERVCNKSDNGVTASELRAIYRDVVKNGRNPNIIFYDAQLRQTDTPWETASGQALWQAYNCQRTNRQELEEASTQELDDGLPTELVRTDTDMRCHETLSWLPKTPASK